MVSTARLYPANAALLRKSALRVEVEVEGVIGKMKG